MKTIVIVGAIVLAGAAVIAVVQSDKKKESAPEIHQVGDMPNAPADSVKPASETPQINPAHGLAGHRCDLPVGAPLTTSSGDAAPAQTPQIINPSQGPLQPASTSPANAPSSPPAGVKINPAHGMPGHRCDIQVGAPLT